MGARKVNQTDKRQNYAFCDNIPSRCTKLKTNTDAKMECHQKSATAENNLRNIISYKEGKSLKDILNRQSKALKVYVPLL